MFCWRKTDAVCFATILFVSLIVATLLIFDLGSMVQLYAFALFFGLALGGSMLVFSLLLVELFGVEFFSRLMGMMGIPFTLGMAIGPLAGGFIFDQTGTYTYAFVLMLVVFTVSAVLALVTRAPKLADGGRVEE